MNNDTILKIALQQSACDCNCAPEDFLSDHNNVHESIADDRARRYLKLPHICNLVSYGTNIVATGAAELLPEIERFINSVLWRITFFPMKRKFSDTAKAVHMSFAFWRRRSLQNCTFRNGRMRCARTESIWTGWPSERLTREGWSGLQAVLQIAIPCGRSVWMCFRNTGDRG